MDRDLLKAISRREGTHNFSSGSLTVDGVLSTVPTRKPMVDESRSSGRDEFRVEKAMSDTDFVQITATTDYATGQAMLYALTRAGYVWQFGFSKQRWDILPTTRA